jgi:broad specificity phosphatase PhoE
MESLMTNRPRPGAQEAVRLYVTRHGRTTANVMHLIQGWSDFPLTNPGRKEIEQFGRGLSGITFSHAYAGTLTRQEDTARIALEYSGNGTVPVDRLEGLREYNFGSFEGKGEGPSWQAVLDRIGFADLDQAHNALKTQMLHDVQEAFHQLDAENYLDTELDEDLRAETAEAVAKRMKDTMRDIAEDGLKRGDSNILVVSSGMSIQSFLNTLSIPDFDFGPMPNTGVTELTYRDGNFSIDGPIGSLKYLQKGRKQ